MQYNNYGLFVKVFYKQHYIVFLFYFTCSVESMIYEANGTQVMLDSKLAKLYQCKNSTKEINQAVKNIPLKFPDRFSWILMIMT